ncbi:hypothetical protein CVT26_004658, partial [Gymnopilus dilepis]
PTLQLVIFRLLTSDDILIVVDLIILSVWGVDHLDPSESQGIVLNPLIAVQSFLTFATTLASTALIAYQIRTTTREIPGNSKRLLVHILEILVQSAAAYSVVAIAFAISTVVPQTTSNVVPWDAASDYIADLFIFTSGLAPTVLVARVAILDENDVYASSAAPTSGSSRLSGLRFHVRTTRGDAESQPQVSDRISRVNRSVESPQVPETEKNKGDMHLVVGDMHDARGRGLHGHRCHYQGLRCAGKGRCSSGETKKICWWAREGSLVSLERGGIGDELNSTILYVFLWGIYTVVYAGTLYLYLTKKSSKNKIILWAISLSYWVYSASAILSWYRDQSAVVNHSETRDALFAALYGRSQWPVLVEDIVTFLMAAVADCILIWRCYHVFGHSFRATLIPGFLLFCEIVVDLIILSVWGVDHLDPSESQDTVLNQLIAAQAFLTFATTVASTTLIAYRIFTTTREIPGSSKRLLVRILEILVQSAATYSLVAIANAISAVVPQTASNEVSWLATNDYTSVLFNFI